MTNYENIAQNYARLVLKGERTLESIPNETIRARVEEIIKEKSEEEQ